DALPIWFVGETVAKKLAKHYKNIDALRNTTMMELIMVDEIGEKIAESVVEFFSKEDNIRIIERLKSFGVQLQISEDELLGQTDKLQGKTFVVSGVFEKVSREELKNLIENNGGKVSGSISSKTSFVVAGDNMGPSKLEKATSLGVPII